MKSFACKACAVGARQSTTLSQFFKKLSRSGKEQTSPATVKSHRMEMARVPTPGNTWNWIVTFTLADGKEVELYTTESHYKELTDGQSSTLTWEGENFVNFEE
jgi:hypothetical protein